MKLRLLRTSLNRALWLFALSLLTGCSTFDHYADKAKQMTTQTGQSLGLVTDRKMQVPDYYSTSYLPKAYSAGQVIELQRFECVRLAECNK